MRYYCLVNVKSGAGKGRMLFSKLQDLSRRGVLSAEIAALDAQNFELQMERAAAFEAVLIAGGDGTFSRAAALLADKPVALGLLPLGLGNDLAKELGVYRLFSLDQPEAILASYAAGRTKDLTVWRADFSTGRSVRFVNYLSFGFDAEAVRLFSHLRTKYPWVSRCAPPLGSLALYALSGCVCGGYKLPTTCRVLDSRGVTAVDASRGKALVFSNIRSYTGLGRASQHGSSFDTKIECSLIESWLGYGAIFLRRNRERCADTAFRIEYAGSTVPFQSDGEPWGVAEGSSCAITRDGRVRVLMPD